MIIDGDMEQAMRDAGLGPRDRRELRNFARFCRLWPQHKQRMLTRLRWRRYLCIMETV